jgi:hydrogenase maturation protease
VRPVLAAGLGNPLLTDEGIGIAVVDALAESRAALLPQVEFADLGTSMMRAVHAMAERRKAVFVDCAFMGVEPGTLRRFLPGDVRSVKALAHFSLHEGDLLQAIGISRAAGECPDEIVLFGIEPESIEPGLELSPTLARLLPRYVEAVAAELP